MVAARAVAGAAEAFAVQPFDIIKTRHQLNHGKNESVLASFRTIYGEGGILRFYRGMSAELVGIIPKSSGMYATYNLVKSHLDVKDDWGDSSFSASVA